MTDKKDVDWDQIKKKIQHALDGPRYSSKSLVSAGDWEKTKKRIEKEIKERKKQENNTIHPIQKPETKELKESKPSKDHTISTPKKPPSLYNFDELDQKINQMKDFINKDQKPVSKDEKAIAQEKGKDAEAKPQTASWDETRVLIENALEKQRKRSKDLCYDELRKTSVKRKKVFDATLKKSKKEIKKASDKKSVRKKGWDVIGKTPLKIKRRKKEKHLSKPSPTRVSIRTTPSYKTIEKRNKASVPVYKQLRRKQERHKRQDAFSSKLKNALKPLRFHVPINVTRLSHLPVKRFLMENLVELLLTSVGLFFISTLTLGNIRIGFTLILIASFMMFLMIEGFKSTDYSVDSRFLSYLAQSPRKQASLFYIKEKKYNPETKKYTVFYKKIITHFTSLKNIYEKIHNYRFTYKSFSLSDRIAIVLIAWTLFLFVITADLEIYFILIFIGILITKELTDIYTTDSFKTRLNAYIIFFLVTYIILIYQKVMQILQS